MRGPYNTLDDARRNLHLWRNQVEIGAYPSIVENIKQRHPHRVVILAEAWVGTSDYDFDAIYAVVED
jgi:hypothetical protein